MEIRGKTGSFFHLPQACYACLVLSELTVKSERLICFNIKMIKENGLVSWRPHEPPERKTKKKKKKKENVKMFGLVADY